MAQFDVFIAKVFYDDGVTSKYRPVVQLFNDENRDNCFAIITSNMRKRETGDLHVKDYITCGLDKPSTIRLNKRITKPTKKKFVGKLSKEDRRNVILNMKKELIIESHLTEEIDDDFNIQSILQEVSACDK